MKEKTIKILNRYLFNENIIIKSDIPNIAEEIDKLYNKKSINKQFKSIKMTIFAIILPVKAGFI